MKNRESGFTLVELAIVIAVMVIMIGSVIVSSSAIKRDTIENNVVSYVKDFKYALNRFYSIYGRYPNNIDDEDFRSRFFKSLNATDGFAFEGYRSVDSRCSNNPSIELKISDLDVVESIKNRGVVVCKQDGEKVVIDVSL